MKILTFPSEDSRGRGKLFLVLVVLFVKFSSPLFLRLSPAGLTSVLSQACGTRPITFVKNGLKKGSSSILLQFHPCGLVHFYPEQLV